MSIDISSLESEELLSWAKLAEAHTEEIREISLQEDINVPKYLLGDVLSTIVGDDEYCFGLKDASFNPNSVQSRKESLLTRLKWEIALMETPEEIRERLQKLLPIVEETDWENEESFFKIKEVWFRDIKDFVKYRIRRNKDYIDAMNYEFDIEITMHPEYKELFFEKLK